MNQYPAGLLPKNLPWGWTGVVSSEFSIDAISRRNSKRQPWERKSHLCDMKSMTPKLDCWLSPSQSFPRRFSVSNRSLTNSKAAGLILLLKMAMAPLQQISGTQVFEGILHTAHSCQISGGITHKGYIYETKNCLLFFLPKVYRSRLHLRSFLRLCHH
jgi:hypothetical protein